LIALNTDVSCLKIHASMFLLMAFAGFYPSQLYFPPTCFFLSILLLFTPETAITLTLFLLGMNGFVETRLVLSPVSLISYWMAPFLLSVNLELASLCLHLVPFCESLSKCCDEQNIPSLFLGVSVVSFHGRRFPGMAK